MDDFTSAFMNAYQIGRQNRIEREQKKGVQSLADLIAKDSQAAMANSKDHIEANPNYQFGQLPGTKPQATSLNDLLPSTGSLLATQQPNAQQFSLNSLLPNQQQTTSMIQLAKAQPMPEFDFNKRNALIAKGAGLGVDYNTVSKMVGDYEKSYTDKYNQQRENDALSGVINATKPEEQKKAFMRYAQVTGKMDAATLRGLLSTNTAKYDDGANIHFFRTDTFGNPVDVGEDGKPVPYYSIAKQLSPGEVQSGELTRRGQDITARGQDLNYSLGQQRIANTGHGGGSGGYSTADKQVLANAKYAIDKHTAWVNAHTNKLTGEAPDETQSPYYQYAVQGQKVLDSYYGIGQGEENNNQSSEQVPMTGDARIDGMIADMRAKGAPEKLINDMVWEEQNKQPAQPKKGLTSDPSEWWNVTGGTD